MPIDNDKREAATCRWPHAQDFLRSVHTAEMRALSSKLFANPLTNFIRRSDPHVIAIALARKNIHAKW